MEQLNLVNCLKTELNELIQEQKKVSKLLTYIKNIYKKNFPLENISNSNCIDVDEAINMLEKLFNEVDENVV